MARPASRVNPQEPVTSPAKGSERGNHGKMGILFDHVTFGLRGYLKGNLMMEETELSEAKLKINQLSQIEMARLWRYGPIGHPYFKHPLFDYFKARFKELGGFTPAISKAID